MTIAEFNAAVKTGEAASEARCRIEAASSTLDSLRKSLRAIQQQCKHPVTKRHPDASGNNDSQDECEICGAIDV